jgi:beta-ureidopropionase / N-carbamoyl-L-amino-acid hydrolase
VKKTSLPVNPDRLWANIMALAEFTEQERPFTRRSFSPLFQKARLWLADQFKAAGLEVRIDSGGNLIGRREGRNPKRGTIAIGSHSDTVPSGGRFDGIAGLASALEIARSLDERQERLSHNLEVIDFLAEEPSEYGLSCVGSRAMAGALEPTMLEFRAAGGESLDAALRRVGGSPDNLKSAKRSDIVAFVELHIEQGIVLERAALDIGVVSSIVGICRVELVFEGTADHAGTTPMSLRQDALVAASNSARYGRAGTSRANLDNLENGRCRLRCGSPVDSPDRSAPSGLEVRRPSKWRRTRRGANGADLQVWHDVRSVSPGQEPLA